MKQNELIKKAASEMGKLGYKARIKKLGGKKEYSKAMTEAINKRWKNKKELSTGQ